MYKFFEKTINLKELPKEIPWNICLLENNEKQTGQICEFLKSDSKLLIVNGFRGSGKSQIVNFTISNSLSEDVVGLFYNCLETTILDDMLLSFFNTFRTYTLMGKITTPKIKVENFTQKINAYFHSITAPILIVIDSFDAMVKENKPEVLNFLKHLLNYENIKIIIITNKFSADDFDGINYEKVTTLAFTEKIFEKYLKENGIKQIGVISNELYKLTKGYYNYLNLSVKIINLRQITLVNFLELCSKSYMGFPEFITREALSLVDPVSAHLFRLLTVMRIPIHINLLKTLHLYDEERAAFFIANSLLSVEGECLYLKDCFREVIESRIPDNVRIKLHSACIDLYNTQLPLKPMERDLMLSRQTMRNEIEYHSMFIPKKPVLTRPVNIAPAPVVQEIQPSAIEQIPQPEPVVPKEETIEEKIDKISFIIEDEGMLDDIADSIKDFIDTSDKTAKLEQSTSAMNLNQIMNAAKDQEQKYNYKQVIMLYQSALTKTDDEDFYTFLPTIYTKLAKAYQNLSDWYEALEYYTQAQDFYVNVSDNAKVYEIKLEIANIYYIMYKHDNAKFILNELEKAKDITNELRVKVYLMQAKLSENLNIEYSYYKKSLPLIEECKDKKLAAELYYRYAAVCDEKDDLRTAAEYYIKCVEVEPNPNTNSFVSTSLANLAELYDEAGNSKAAIKYYAQSMKIDTEIKNYNGLYSSSIHLAEIYSASNDEKSLEYMNKALDYAKILKEPFYIAGASIEIGDFYFLHKDNKKAYEFFIEAYKIARKTFSKDNLDKIISRINDIKRRIGETEFSKLQGQYGK